MSINIIILAMIVLALGAAVVYIIRAKKANPAGCIGCSGCSDAAQAGGCEKKV